MARTLLPLLTAAVLCCPLWLAAQPAKGGTGYKDLRWAELLPAGWDPVRSLGVAPGTPLNLEDPKLRKVWDDAPVNMTLNGQKVRLLGYLVPLDEAIKELREFLLVPEWGACIHTPAPPANQIIHVLLKTPAKGFQTMDPVHVSGVLKAQRAKSDWAPSGYAMPQAEIEPYRAPKR